MFCFPFLVIGKHGLREASVVFGALLWVKLKKD